MFRCFIIAIALFLLQACASTADQQNNQVSNSSAEELGKYVGVLKNNTYENPSLPITLNLPKSWFLTLPDKTSVVIDASDEAIRIDPLVRKTYRILSLNKYQKNSIPKGEFNAGLTLLVTDNPRYVASTSAEAHNQAIKGVIEKSDKNYQFEESYNKELGGLSFNVVSASINVKSNLTLFQNYQSVIFDGRMVTFIVTYFDEEDRQKLDSIVGSLEFK